MIESMSPWALPLAVFIPSVLVIMLGLWAIRTVRNGMDGISKQILSWHGSQESVEAHEKMWQRFMETDHFRTRLSNHIKAQVDTTVNPMIARMDTLAKSVQSTTIQLTTEVREKRDSFRQEVLNALLQHKKDNP